MVLSVAGVAKAFGPDVVLRQATFRVEAGEKVALVGRNGTGKSTLLRLITRQYEPDAGSVTVGKGLKIGYLRQEAPITGNRTVLEEAKAGLEEHYRVQARLQELETAMEAGTATTDDLDEYAQLHDVFLNLEGYALDQEVRTTLLKLGFTEDEFDRPTEVLSGGEKTRLAIARILLERPALLILDEPTNHLDLQATEWLEGWIRQYRGAVLLVSHDRAFLESTAQRVLDLRDGEVFSYPGPFSKFRELRAEELARQAEVAKRQAIEMAKMDEYVRRFMNSQRTAQARGRLKLLERMRATAIQAPKASAQMKGGFGTGTRSGDQVLVAKDVSIGFPDHTLLSGLDWTVRLGERWGVIGENGIGKSTLLRALLGQGGLLAGEARLGSNVVLGYFTQDARDLDLEESPLDSLVWDLDMTPGEARDLLGRFLLTGDDVYRPIKTLSGGEKNKLSLARLTHIQPNLLVLDEPTNHLDMDSREALGQVLREYKGTLVLISHDRWLLGEVTDQVLDLRKTGAIQFPGGFREYQTRRGAASSVTAPVVTVAPRTLDDAPAPPTLSPRELSKEIERMTKVVADAEAHVHHLETELAVVEQQLANLGPMADVLALTQSHQQLQEAVEGAMAVWEAETLRLEDLRAQREPVVG